MRQIIFISSTLISPELIWIDWTINEWKSSSHELSTRENRIKTNKAVKINLTAYKKCHNYHLKAIVLGIFYLNADEMHQQQCECTFTLCDAKLIRSENLFLQDIKAVKCNLLTGWHWTSLNLGRTRYKFSWIINWINLLLTSIQRGIPLRNLGIILSKLGFLNMNMYFSLSIYF